jgi:hypothetical protein
MKQSIPGYTKIGIGITLLLFACVYIWLYLCFPVYDERQVKQTIERNIPIGTSQKKVIVFLNTLKTNDVYYEADDFRIAAYFPETIFYMRGWRCIEVTFRFESGKVKSYTMKRVSI